MSTHGRARQWGEPTEDLGPVLDNRDIWRRWIYIEVAGGQDLHGSRRGTMKNIKVEASSRAAGIELRSEFESLLLLGAK
jgi:hypothetical protein